MLINHSVLGEHYYMLDDSNKVATVSDSKLFVWWLKKFYGFSEITEGELDQRIYNGLTLLIARIRTTVVTHNKTEYTNILSLSYHEGFCKFVQIQDNKVLYHTISGNIHVNDSRKSISNYLSLIDLTDNSESGKLYISAEGILKLLQKYIPLITIK